MVSSWYHCQYVIVIVLLFFLHNNGFLCVCTLGRSLRTAPVTRWCTSASSPWMDIRWFPQTPYKVTMEKSPASAGTPSSTSGSLGQTMALSGYGYAKWACHWWDRGVSWAGQGRVLLFRAKGNVYDVCLWSKDC